MQFPKDFSSTITLNSGAGEGGTDIAASNTGYVYWTTSSDIRVGKSSTTNVESVYVSQFMGERPQTITASGQYVAWISKLSDGSGTSTVWACAATSSCSKSVPLASKQFAGQHVGNITFDASDIVYWTATDSAGKNVFVYSCAPTGCNNNKPTVVAQVPTQGKAFAGGVAVDSTFAYFLVGDGNGTTLFKVQK